MMLMSVWYSKPTKQARVLLSVTSSKKQPASRHFSPRKHMFLTSNQPVFDFIWVSNDAYDQHRPRNKPIIIHTPRRVRLPLHHLGSSIIDKFDRREMYEMKETDRYSDGSLVRSSIGPKRYEYISRLQFPILYHTRRYASNISGEQKCRK